MSNSKAPESLLQTLLMDGNGGAEQLEWADVDRWNTEQGCLWLSC